MLTVHINLVNLKNILSNVNRQIKNVFHEHGVTLGNQATTTAAGQKMLVPTAIKARRVLNDVGKAGQKTAWNQSYLGRVLSRDETPPESPKGLSTKERKKDRIHGELGGHRKQHSKNWKHRTTRQKKQKNGKTKSKKAHRVPAHTYKKMLEYCQKLKTRTNDKTKEYYKTKGCKDPRKCKSYTKIHRITHDYESVTYRSKTASRFCSKYLPKLDAIET